MVNPFTSSVVKQVDSGFAAIKKQNAAEKDAEVEGIKETRARKIGSIFSESNARANKLFELEEELDMDDFEVEDISQILKDSAAEIAKVNEEGDKDIESVASAHTAVDLNNNAVLKDLVKDIMDNDGDDGEVKAIVADADLPFDVNTEVNSSEKTLERILERSQDDHTASL